MGDYQRTDELHKLQNYLTAPHNANFVAETACLHLQGNKVPWQATHIFLKAGEAFSIFARGRIYWTNYQTSRGTSARPNLYGDTSFHLWARVSRAVS